MPTDEKILIQIMPIRIDSSSTCSLAFSCFSSVIQFECCELLPLVMIFHGTLSCVVFIEFNATRKVAKFLPPLNWFLYSCQSSLVKTTMHDTV